MIRSHLVLFAAAAVPLCVGVACGHSSQDEPEAVTSSGTTTAADLPAAAVVSAPAPVPRKTLTAAELASADKSLKTFDPWDGTYKSLVAKLGPEHGVSGPAGADGTFYIWRAVENDKCASLQVQKYAPSGKPAKVGPLYYKHYDKRATTTDEWQRCAEARESL